LGATADSLETIPPPANTVIGNHIDLAALQTQLSILRRTPWRPPSRIDVPISHAVVRCKREKYCGPVCKDAGSVEVEIACQCDHEPCPLRPKKHQAHVPRALGSGLSRPIGRCSRARPRSRSTSRPFLSFVIREPVDFPRSSGGSGLVNPCAHAPRTWWARRRSTGRGSR